MPKVVIPNSGRVVCNVKIRPYDSPIMRSFEFKIDTGADFSTVSKDTLYTLGYTDEWINDNKKPAKGSTTVATGEVIESFYVELPLVNIYGVRGRNYPFYILMNKDEDLQKPTCKGCKYTEAKKLDYRLLLGNDILSCFKIIIDRDNGWVDMERRVNLDTRNANYPDSHLNFLEAD